MSEIKGRLKIIIDNFGIKGVSGDLPPADLYLDCRTVHNPAHCSTCNGANGDHPVVQECVERSSEAVLNAFHTLIIEGINHLPVRRMGRDPYADPFRVQCFCAWGVHRSRATKHILGRILKQHGWNVKVIMFHP